MNDIEKTLAQRGNRYGPFAGHAAITQELKAVFSKHPKWVQLADDQKEALEMIAHKIGRIFNGDQNYDDSWVDISGYAKLVADRLTAETAVSTKEPVRAEQEEDKTWAKEMAGLFESMFGKEGVAAAEKAALGDTCNCPGCTLRRQLFSGEDKALGKLKAMFPGAEIVMMSKADKPETKH